MLFSISSTYSLTYLTNASVFDTPSVHCECSGVFLKQIIDECKWNC